MSADPRPVSVLRLNLLRAVYALLVLGTGSLCWPALVDLARHWEFYHGVVLCMLGALSALSLIGLRYPLTMIPLLFWEFGWKLIWMARVALPAWLSGHMDEDTASNVIACAVVIVVPLALPWGYVIDRYLRRRGDPWRGVAPHSS